MVTHLAQVASFADRQLVVSKSTDGAAGDDGAADDAMVTVTGVAEVAGEERVRELARMLSGKEDSEAARLHAVELLAGSGSVGATT
ncbi:hypothetical protein GCM10025865_30720 [Paraoerskovia sediminicola]|uniref:DNA repair protein RecN n=2 Tax=Paraoerskovia sediminicola TaxID=1138587 RepID=A0ABM8G6R0_9CELL|nr:hypothetical protein GCM10025865_30720 [Paraoerskovia sediminicola]